VPPPTITTLFIRSSMGRVAQPSGDMDAARSARQRGARSDRHVRSYHLNPTVTFRVSGTPSIGPEVLYIGGAVALPATGLQITAAGS
jgi:hypothetical protein